MNNGLIYLGNRGIFPALSREYNFYINSIVGNIIFISSPKNQKL